MNESTESNNVRMATIRLMEIFRDLARRFKAPLPEVFDASKESEAWLPYHGSTPTDQPMSYLGTRVFGYEHPKSYYTVRVSVNGNKDNTEFGTKVEVTWTSFRTKDLDEVMAFSGALQRAASDADYAQTAFDAWHEAFTAEEQVAAYKEFYKLYENSMKYFQQRWKALQAQGAA